jgi:drug/metabolite transporter (DMT)-like permease
MRSRFGVPEALAFIGALAMVVSVFLVFVKEDGVSSHAFEAYNLGVPLFLVAVLCFGAFAARARGILPGLAFVGLGFAGLALVGYFAYDYFATYHNELGNLREGFYLAGVGALLVFLSGIAKMR